MIDITLITNALYGLIGWEKGYRDTDPKINGTVLESSTGQYYNRNSNLLELENLQAIGPEFKELGYADYSAATSYSIGDNVMYNGDAYTSLTDSNLNNDPDTDLVNWQHRFSKWLEDKTKASIFNLSQNLTSLKQLNVQTKSLIDTVRLFDSRGSNNSLISKSGRIVGFSLKVKNFEGLMMLLQKVGVQFTQTETINLYLYHTSQMDAPIATLAVSGNTANRFQWYDFKQRMPFLEDYNSGGEYKLVYYEDDLTGQAIKYNLDNTGGNLPCGTCGGGNLSRKYYNVYSKWLTAQAFYVDAANIPGGNAMWDTEDEVNVNLQNWGLNVQLDARCDITNTVINNKDILINALILQVELDMAKETIRSTRTSPGKDSVVSNSFLALEGGERGLKSLTHQLDEEMKKMDFNISRLKSPCFPCEQKGGVQIGYL